MDYPRARLFSTRRKENLLFSRVIHARFLLMQRKTNRQKKKRDSEPCIYELNRYKKKEGQNISSNSVKIEKKKWHTHAHLNG